MKKRKLFFVFVSTFALILFGVTSSYTLNKSTLSVSFSLVDKMYDKYDISYDNTSKETKEQEGNFSETFASNYLKPISLENIEKGDFVIFYSKNNNGVKVAKEAYIYNGDNTISNLSESKYKESIEFSPTKADEEFVSCFRFNPEELIINIEEFLTLIKGDER